MKDRNVVLIAAVVMAIVLACYALGAFVIVHFVVKWW